MLPGSYNISHPSTDVAFVVVGYNSANWLHECFSALEREMTDSISVIYVDNASSDDSVAIARAYNCVAVIRKQRNTGFGDACNSGANLAVAGGAGILFFLNPDTRLHAGSVEAVRQAFARSSELGIVGPLQTEYSNGKPLIARFNTWSRRAIVAGQVYPTEQHRIPPCTSSFMENWRLQHHDPVRVRYVNGGALAVRTEVFRACGGFNASFFLFFEEVDLCRRARWLGFSSALLPDQIVEHAWGGHASGERLRLWTRSKYHYILSDCELDPTARRRLVRTHLRRDMVLALRGQSSLSALLSVLLSLLNPISSGRRSKRRNYVLFRGSQI